MNTRQSVLDKVEYAARCLAANPAEEPTLRLFVGWLTGDANPDEVVHRIPVLTKPPQNNPNQLDMFAEVR